MKFSMFIHPPRPKPRSTTGFPSPSTMRLPRTLNGPCRSPCSLLLSKEVAGSLALDRALGDPLDKAPLHDQEYDHDGHRAQEGSRHDCPVLLAVGADQGREP